MDLYYKSEISRICRTYHTRWVIPTILFSLFLIIQVAVQHKEYTDYITSMSYYNNPIRDVMASYTDLYEDSNPIIESNFGSIVAKSYEQTNITYDDLVVPESNYIIDTQNDEIEENDDEIETVDVSINVTTIPTELTYIQGEYPIDNTLCRSYNFTYMDYHKVTAVNSRQYALLYHPDAYTDEIHGIRMYDGRYCIALGYHFNAPVGTYVDVYLDNGNVIPCIVGDIKALCDTDETQTYQAFDGSVVEIVVDYDYFTMGAGQYSDIFNGTVNKIIVY